MDFKFKKKIMVIILEFIISACPKIDASVKYFNYKLLLTIVRCFDLKQAIYPPYS